MLSGRGGNIGILTGNDGVFMIDTKFADLTEDIQAEVQALSEQPIRLVLDTHWHPDHVSGNENLAQTGALILAQNGVRTMLSQDQTIEILDQQIPAYPVSALPIATFNDNLTLHWNDETIRVSHFAPAHTETDVMVQFESANVIHTGDVFFNGLYPFIDIEHGGSLTGMIAADDRVLALADDQTQLIPGHGSLGNKSQLLDFRNMLATVQQKARSAIDAEESLKAFIASDPLADLEGSWSDAAIPAETFLEIAYQDSLQHQSS